MHPGLRDADDVERLERVLDDVPMEGSTRRSLLRYAAAGAVAVSAISPARALAKGAKHGNGKRSGVSAQDILNTAITAEALAITYLSGVLQSAGSLQSVRENEDALKAANQAEYDHYKALRGLGAKPVATKFWVPARYFTDENVFPLIEQLEGVFVNAYLYAATQFAKKDMAEPARYAGEISGVEAQHRLVARLAQGQSPPNDLAFERYELKTLDAHVKAIEDTGIGLGKRGPKDDSGSFHSFPGSPPTGTTISIKNNSPR